VGLWNEVTVGMRPAALLESLKPEKPRIRVFALEVFHKHQALL
jgi:hypothetical protein